MQSMTASTADETGPVQSRQVQARNGNGSPPPRLLVVDDEPGVREGCRRTLVSQGYVTDTAPDGRQGLELLGEHDYALVLVDLKMPGMDGLEFLAAAQQLETETVFVVITAFATLSMAVDATKRGAYDFVAKPFTPEELVSVAERALAHAAMVRERNRLYEERDNRLLELATEKGRLLSVVEAMSDGVIVTNREGQVVLYNAAALRLTACDTCPDQPQLAAERVTSPALDELISEAASAEGVERLGREIQVGTEAHEVVAASASPVADEDGNCLGVVTVLHDVSQLKKIELLMAQFVNMVAHELRAPLAAIDSQVVAIREGYVSDPQQQNSLLDRAHLRLQTLLELVNDLLALSRLDAGAVRRELRPLDLGSVAREVCGLMETMVQERGLTLSLDIAAALPPVEADKQEVITILTNLINNAIKYNRPQGAVAVRLDLDFPYAVIEVTDTGVGISEAAQDRVFEEFFRERGRATERETGTGLGLAIVARLVRSYQGSIALRSAVGAGSTFTVRLPLDQSVSRLRTEN